MKLKNGLYWFTIFALCFIAYQQVQDNIRPNYDSDNVILMYLLGVAPNFFPAIGIPALFLILVVFFFLTEIGRNIYRPFIYSNNIDDYGIADSIGNSGGIIVQIFFSLALLNSPSKKVFNVIGFIVIGYILYEILQPYLPRGVFDWKDIYGTLIGGVISLFALLFVKKMVKNKVIYEFK